MLVMNLIQTHVPGNFENPGRDHWPFRNGQIIYLAVLKPSLVLKWPGQQNLV